MPSQEAIEYWTSAPTQLAAIMFTAAPFQRAASPPYLPATCQSASGPRRAKAASRSHNHHAVDVQASCFESRIKGSLDRSLLLSDPRLALVR